MPEQETTRGGRPHDHFCPGCGHYDECEGADCVPWSERRCCERCPECAD